MNILKSFWQIIIEAIFPLSEIEHHVLSLNPEEAFKKLPKANTPSLANAFSVFAYKDKLVTKLIWNIKYKKSQKAIDIGAFALSVKLANLITTDKLKLIDHSERIYLIPIPMSLRRMHERGFNQTELLADKIISLDKSGLFSVIKDLLIRKEHQDRQTLKSRQERLQSTKHIFAVNENAAASFLNKENQPLLIVIDDVITTGSTMDSAFETLKQAGFLRVFGLSLAH